MSVQISETRCVDVIMTTVEWASVRAGWTSVCMLEMMNERHNSGPVERGLDGNLTEWLHAMEYCWWLTTSCKWLNSEGSNPKEGNKLSQLHCECEGSRSSEGLSKSVLDGRESKRPKNVDRLLKGGW